MSSDGPAPVVEPLLQALAADPHPRELAGFERPLADYRAAFPTSRPSAKTTWRRSMLSTLLGAKVGATVAGVAVALGGTAVVVYAGSLHTGSQNAAHSVIGAPAAAPTGTASPHPSATKTATGPDVTGSAAFGLCNAWSHHQAKGANTHGKSKDAPPFRNLVTAAGGADKVAAFCAAIPHPTDTSEPSDEPSTESTPAHPTGRPSSLPTPSSPGHGTGRPSTLPTPSSGHPTGKPSSLPTPTSAPPA